MRTYLCTSCGDEYEVDEAEGRQRKRLCSTCRDIEKREKEMLREWEHAKEYV